MALRLTPAQLANLQTRASARLPGCVVDEVDASSKGTGYLRIVFGAHTFEIDWDERAVDGAISRTRVLADLQALIDVARTLV